MATRPRSIERKFSCVATATCQCFENRLPHPHRKIPFYIKPLTHPFIICVIQDFLHNDDFDELVVSITD